MNRTKTYSKTNVRVGAVAVEFALVLPLLFLCLFGFYELSRASMIRHTTESSAYEGARVGIVPGATDQAIRDQVAFVLSSVGVDDFTVDVEQNRGEGSRQTVLVRVNVPYTELLTGGLFARDLTFVGETELTQEGIQ